MQKVVFKCYRNHSFGKHKGKVNPESIVHIVLWRDPSQGETVGSTLKRCKSMFEDHTVHVVIQNAAETDAERASRYKRDGLEVVNPIVLATQQRAEAGDETMVKGLGDILADSLNRIPITVADKVAQPVAA